MRIHILQSNLKNQFYMLIGAYKTKIEAEKIIESKIEEENYTRTDFLILEYDLDTNSFISNTFYIK
jgi:hypothetical protein